MDKTIKTYFFNLYQMLLSDTEVDPKELALFYQIGKEKGISDNDLNEIIFSPNKFTVPESFDIKIEYLYSLARMAWADGKIEEDEIKWLKICCEKFGFLPENSEVISRFLLDEVEKQSTFEQILTTIKNNM